ncbi:MAG: beta-ketoacyl-ACP synthase II [Deltaproteobacteria bacterium]|nr:beta-ketoacyl-ACP synthase II [Deltaproteobacteria bacterium]
MKRRVAITGIGLVTPLGVGLEATWRALLEGRSGAVSVPALAEAGVATTFAARVRGFDESRFASKRELRTMDPFIHFALGAAVLANEDAGLELDEAGGLRAGAYLGTGFGGLLTIEAQHEVLLERGARRVSPYLIPASIANLAAGQVSIRLGLKGPNLSPVSACATGAHAVGEAARCIQYGDADVMFAGGSEASLTPLCVAGFSAMKALSRRNDDPAGASRPFDRGRDGFVMGEGAGVVVLEEMARAKARGARIYCELVGYGRTADAHHITAPAPGGEGAARCMRAALDDARVDSEQVGHVNAHGTSTRFNDAFETQAMHSVFGRHSAAVMVTANKSMFGHLLGAAGSVEAAISAQTLATGIIPPTINLEDPDPDCDLTIVKEGPQEEHLEYVLSNSFGFGGTNACLLFRRV